MPDVPLRAQMDQKALADLGRTLSKTLDDLTATLREGAKRAAEAREVSVLFAIYRQPEAAGPDRIGLEREKLARLRAAIAEYDTAFLADLIAFGEFLQREARPVWERRAS